MANKKGSIASGVTRMFNRRKEIVALSTISSSVHVTEN